MLRGGKKTTPAERGGVGGVGGVGELPRVVGGGGGDAYIQIRPRAVCEDHPSADLNTLLTRSQGGAAAPRKEERAFPDPTPLGG